MTTAELIRAWKDEDYRLTRFEESTVDHPSGSPAAEIYQTVGQQNSTCDTYSSCYHVCSA